MAEFHNYLPKGKILEIGSGVGKDAEALTELGYDYIGIDPSVGLLKIAQERNPNGQFIQKSVEELEPSFGQFDGFWAAAVLLHIPKEEMLDSLLCISSVLKDGGIGVITLKEGIGEEVDKGTNRFYSYFTQPEFSNYLIAANFEILEVERREEKDDNWLVFYVKMNKLNNYI